MTPAAMAALHKAAYTDERPWTKAEFAALLAQPGLILTGDKRSMLLGRVTLDEAEVLTLATHPDARRQGLAHAALRAFEWVAASHGAVTAFLEVSALNTAAHSLYTGVGYTEVARRRAYYTTRAGIPFDAIVMRKPLLQPVTPRVP